MSKWDKLLSRICSLDKGLRFDELRKVLESYGYEMKLTIRVRRRLTREEAVTAHFGKPVTTQ